MTRFLELLRFLRRRPGRRLLALRIALLFLLPARCGDRELRLGRWRLRYHDGRLLRELLWEIFVLERYEVGELDEDAVIVDAGANIGLAALFFHERYPRARIHCYEPEPRAFALLQDNLRMNRLDRVSLYPYALSDREGAHPLYVRRDVAGDIGASTVLGYRDCYHSRAEICEETIECRMLSKELEGLGRVDLLKLDIEGGEHAVFVDLFGGFDKIQRLCMEVHAMPGEDNPLSFLLRVLEEEGFQVVLDAPRRLDWPESYELYLKARRRSARRSTEVSMAALTAAG